MATEKLGIYRCPYCGGIVEVINPGENPVCCGSEMLLMTANTGDGATEKHVPVAEPCGNGTRVRVGSVNHPMTPEHYIMWIEITDGKMLHRAELAPGDAPEAYFEVPYSDQLSVREYCNIHGLWRK